MKASDFFSPAEQEKILSAICEAEKNTSGEIRVHIELHCKIDVLDRAAYLFKELRMHKTEKRNGVLFYLAISDKKFAVIGDAGINAVVPENFWEEVKNILSEHFKAGQFADGLSKGIIKAGEILKTHFPHQQNDINELPDEISFNNKS